MAAVTSSSVVPPGELVSTADDRVIMRGLDWRGYQTLLALRGERPQPRMSYLDGAVELMTTSWDHERIKKRIGALLEAYLYELDVAFGGYGQWTLQKQDVEAGVEADDCYQLGEDQGEWFPDLAIEVVWTSGGLDKLEIYRRLGVREVWFWIGDSITVHVLTDRGYERRERSACLPQIELDLICRFVDLPKQSDAVKLLREAVTATR
jgi:Uma2 family endonuclease